MRGEILVTFHYRNRGQNGSLSVNVGLFLPVTICPNEKQFEWVMRNINVYTNLSAVTAMHSPDLALSPAESQLIRRLRAMSPASSAMVVALVDDLSPPSPSLALVRPTPE